MVALSFNANQFDPNYGSNPQLPPGRYKGVIKSTEGKPTKDGAGSYLQLELLVIEGPHNGESQMDRLNLFNSEPLTVKIANGQLSAYCHVTNTFVFQNTDELCNKPFQFEIAQQKKNPEYTEVVRLWDINGNDPGKSGVAQPQHQSAAPPLQAPPVAAPPAAWGGAPAAVDQPGQVAPPAAQWGGQPAAQPSGWANR
jgi:hypothetical protein